MTTQNQVPEKTAAEKPAAVPAVASGQSGDAPTRTLLPPMLAEFAGILDEAGWDWEAQL